MLFAGTTVYSLPIATKQLGHCSIACAVCLAWLHTYSYNACGLVKCFKACSSQLFLAVLNILQLLLEYLSLEIKWALLVWMMGNSLHKKS